MKTFYDYLAEQFNTKKFNVSSFIRAYNEELRKKGWAAVALPGDTTKNNYFFVQTSSNGNFDKNKTTSGITIYVPFGQENKSTKFIIDASRKGNDVDDRVVKNVFVPAFNKAAEKFKNKISLETK